MSTFRTELFTVVGTDGQSEVLNRCLETYLCCMCTDSPSSWCKYLPLAEYWYNTNYHTVARKTPYEILYCQPPPIHLPYLSGESKVQAVDRSLIAKEEALKLLKHHLSRAQNRMKQLADKKRSDRKFDIGDRVFLKLQEYRQTSIAIHPFNKLTQKYYGPFQISEKIGAVAYRLKLPPSSSIRPTFHVSLLKPYKGPLPPPTATLPPLLSAGSGNYPEKLLDTRIVKSHNHAETQWLIK